MKLRLVVLALTVVALLVSAGPPSPFAAAPPATAAGAPAGATRMTLDPAVLARLNPLATSQVTGAVVRGPAAAQTQAGAGAFSGSVTVRSFAAQDGHLVARLAATGTLLDGARTQPVSTMLAATATVTGTCQVLTLVLGPVHLDLLGLAVDLNGSVPTTATAAMTPTAAAPLTLTITGEQGPGELLGNLVCGIANLLNGPAAGASATTVAQQLNLLNTTIQRTLGRLTRSFAAQNGRLVETVTYNGRLVGTAAVTPTASMTCTVLTLNLSPLHLDLAGLVIDLSAVHLSITAVSGPGNLLGNLLCRTSTLLASTPPQVSAAAVKLNELFTVLRLQHLFEGFRT